MATRRNVEIKARCLNPDAIHARLRQARARYAGRDLQTDTYFLAGTGRLKVREGTIENALIAYARNDEDGPRISDVRLFRSADMSELRDVLVAGIPVDVVVEKSRHIYFLDNVKVHVDTVPPLGHFVEIEAIDSDGSVSSTELHQQCVRLMDLLGVRQEQLISTSYSDLLRGLNTGPRWEQ